MAASSTPPELFRNISERIGKFLRHAWPESKYLASASRHIYHIIFSFPRINLPTQTQVRITIKIVPKMSENNGQTKGWSHIWSTKLLASVYLFEAVMLTSYSAWSIRYQRETSFEWQCKKRTTFAWTHCILHVSSRNFSPKIFGKLSVRKSFWK